MSGVEREAPESRNADRAPFRFTLRRLFIFVFACSVVCAVLFRLVPDADRSVRDRALRAACNDNLKQIGLALNIYHDIHGCFPPPFIADTDGKPMHSWRRLLLDYLDIPPQGIVMPVDLGEPWDSPKNLAAAKRVPSCYGCPTNKNWASGFTNYVMIVGSQTAARPHGNVSRDDISDGLDRTIIVAEIADSDILWTEPRDLDFDQMSFRVNDKSKPSISSRHFSGALVLLAHGGTYYITDSMDTETLKALLTRSAGDVTAAASRD